MYSELINQSDFAAIRRNFEPIAQDKIAQFRSENPPAALAGFWEEIGCGSFDDGGLFITGGPIDVDEIYEVSSLAPPYDALRLFGGDSMGNSYGFLPEDNSVYFFDHESLEIHRIADDFYAFLVSELTTMSTFDRYQISSTSTGDGTS